MTDLSKLIEELEGLAEKATPGDWMGYSEPEVDLPYGLFAGSPLTGMQQIEPLVAHDIDLIVALKNNLPTILQGLRAIGERDRLREALGNINRKASPNPERTMSEASSDLYWCACEARAALKEPGHEG